MILTHTKNCLSKTITFLGELITLLCQACGSIVSFSLLNANLGTPDEFEHFIPASSSSTTRATYDRLESIHTTPPQEPKPIESKQTQPLPIPDNYHETHVQRAIDYYDDEEEAARIEIPYTPYLFQPFTDGEEIPELPFIRPLSPRAIDADRVRKMPGTPFIHQPIAGAGDVPNFNLTQGSVSFGTFDEQQNVTDNISIFGLLKQINGNSTYQNSDTNTDSDQDKLCITIDLSQN